MNSSIHIVIDNTNWLFKKQIWNGRKYKILQYRTYLLEDGVILYYNNRTKLVMNRRTAKAFQGRANIILGEINAKEDAKHTD